MIVVIIAEGGVSGKEKAGWERASLAAKTVQKLQGIQEVGGSIS